MDKNPSKPDQIRIRSENIRTIYIPSLDDIYKGAGHKFSPKLHKGFSFTAILVQRDCTSKNRSHREMGSNFLNGAKTSVMVAGAHDPVSVVTHQ